MNVRGQETKTRNWTNSEMKAIKRNMVRTVENKRHRGEEGQWDKAGREE